MKDIPNLNQAIIVGGGISGLSLSLILAQHGINVTLLEKDSEHLQNQEDERSANFTVTNRGLILLEKLGIRQQVLENSIELTHRVIHHQKQTIYQKYGSDSLDHPRSIRRSDLLQILKNKTVNAKNLAVRHNSCVTDLNKNDTTVTIRHSNTLETLKGDIIIGADGAFSVVRRYITQGHLIDTKIHYFDWVYKKLVFSPSEAKSLNLSLNGLHVWPRKDGILFGLPNLDGSVACIFCTKFNKNMDLQGEFSNSYVLNTFKSLFPSFKDFSYLLNSFNQAKICGLINIEISKFHYREKVVLVGDACHAVFPFYGQGMNAALEDCLALTASLKKYDFCLHPDAFIHYNETQKKSADALQHLSTQHFFELRDQADTAWYEAKAKVSRVLEKLFPNIWKNEYSLIVRGELTYDAALKKIKRQKLYKWIFLIKLFEYCLVPLIFFKRKKLILAEFRRQK
ncbi:FAD-dependent oxidoreductase [Parachlamydia acanthamoebae]|uniref:FAD-dependent oxidoreductase n=1 Tax=Parachlamydia acanthamoebae TaxID=83552 RepID=UPI00075144E6|nr:NAD(P)/FAD-dependent oxidoreductase [Parachlamydia acanthamoebae]